MVACTISPMTTSRTTLPTRSRRARPVNPTPDVAAIVRKVVDALRDEHWRAMDDQRREFENQLEQLADERTQLVDLLDDYRTALDQATKGAGQPEAPEGR